LPLSTANFEVASIAPEVGVPVKFENLSFNASAYAWDFGDGNKDSLTIAPEHTYQQPGDYSVRMRAYTDDGQVSEAVQQVSVGERFLTGMFIMNISMVDQNGDPWDDDGSGPDVLFALAPADASTAEEFVIVFIDSLNVAEGRSTPIGITTDNLVPDDYKLTNEDFVIELLEVDTVENEPSYVTMVTTPGFNPVVPNDEFITVTKRADGTGDIVIPYAVLEEYQWYLQFEIR
jgi:PKD repeat protein